MIPLHAALTKEDLDAASLARIHEDYARTPGFLSEVIAELRLEDDVTQPRASWLLLRHATEHLDLPENILRAAVEAVANSPSWEARLHLCQVFSRCDCPVALAEPLLEFLSECAANRRAFLRAWAFAALHRLKGVSPALRPEIDGLWRRARLDKSKAVQARIRQLTGSPAPATAGTSPAQRFARIVATLRHSPKVSVGTSKKGFGSSALCVDGKIFAMLTSKGGLVVKLPKARVDALVALGVGTRFEPARGRVMKEWLVSAPASDEDGVSLAREAMNFVGAVKP